MVRALRLIINQAEVAAIRTVASIMLRGVKQRPTPDFIFDACSPYVRPARNDFVYHVIRRPGEILHRIGGGLIELVRRFQPTLRNNDHRGTVHRCTRERMKLRSNTRFRVPAHFSTANRDESPVPVTTVSRLFSLLPR